MKKISKSVGKLVLASSIGLTGIGSTLVVPTTQAHAQEVTKKIEFDKLGAQIITLTTESKWEQAHSMLSPNLQAIVTKEMLPKIWASMSAPFGKVSAMAQKDILFNGVHTNVTYSFTAENGPFEIVLEFNHLGQLDDLNVKQAYPPNIFLNPSYNHPDNYTEKQVVVGEGTFALPGVLTIPKGEGPFPVVVLVHGSGPNDMDETAYAFKPFRDMAVGLANQGIAVLRYDKRTNAHALKSGLNTTFTIQEETVLDANLAVKTLKKIPEIDSTNIFVVGHSQGAFALPLIEDGDKNHDIKGMIGIAGPAGKFQNLLLWQYEQILKRAKDMNAPAEQLKALEANIAFMIEQIGLINNPSYSKDTIPANFQLGNPYWWYDIRDFQPTDLAKKQELPLLLLQGGKDVQVPVSEFQLWKDALKDRNNVDYKLYPNMFHFLVDIPGKPDGQSEYMTPGTVSEELIADISTWVKTGELKPNVDLTIFKDYKPDQPWSKGFEWAIEKGIIYGYATDRLLKPEVEMSELQFLKVFFRYNLGAELKDESPKAIYALAKEHGFHVTGKADAHLTRGDAALFLANSFLKTKKAMTIEEAVHWLYDREITNGFADEDGKYPKTFESFKADAAISRGDLVTFLMKLDGLGLGN